MISHPHFYTTYASWATEFKCPVIISRDDEEWLCRQQPKDVRVEFIDGPVGTAKEIVPGVTAVKLGGHFPGSLVLHWENQLFIADTFLTVPVGGFCCPHRQFSRKKPSIYVCAPFHIIVIACEPSLWE